jgi:hypothetical protein
MTKFKLITAATALALALPAAASAHHDDHDYGLVKMPTLKLVDFSPRHDGPSVGAPQVQSPAQVTGPQVKVYRRTYVKGGSGLLGLKISCKSVGLGCGGNIAVGRNGRVGTRNFRLRNDAPQIVKVSISRGAISKLAYSGTLSLGLKIRVSDDAGNASVTTGNLKLVNANQKLRVMPRPRF